MLFLKVTVSRDFDTFFIKQLHLGPIRSGKNEFPKIFVDHAETDSALSTTTRTLLTTLTHGK